MFNQFFHEANLRKKSVVAIRFNKNLLLDEYNFTIFAENFIKCNTNVK